MHPLTFGVAGATLLIPLLLAEKQESTAGKLVFKPVLSSLFVLVAWLQDTSLHNYVGWMLTGLVFSWVGDLFLVFSSRKLFLAGLVSFLLGHVCYTTGFFTNGTLHLWGLVGAAVVLLVSCIIFLWLRPHLGPMEGPVIAYVIVITAMVSGALALFFNDAYQPTGRWCVLVGAVSFYISDILVARDRFVSPGFENRLYGLPPYYLAQFLFAYSIGSL